MTPNEQTALRRSLSELTRTELLEALASEVTCGEWPTSSMIVDSIVDLRQAVDNAITNPENE